MAAARLVEVRRRIGLRGESGERRELRELGELGLFGGPGRGPTLSAALGLHARLGWPIWLARTVIEGSALVAGWLLGGSVGAGTVLFALAIGPLVAFFLRRVSLAPVTPTTLEAY